MPHPEAREIILNASAVADSMERLEQRMNGAIDRLEDRVNKAFEKHDLRTLEIEKWQWGMKAYITVLAAVFAVAGTIVAYLVVDEARAIKQQLWNQPSIPGRR